VIQFRFVIDIMFVAVRAQKQTSVALLVPDGTNTHLFLLILVALLLKVIHLIHVIIRQVRT